VSDMEEMIEEGIILDTEAELEKKLKEQDCDG